MSTIAQLEFARHHTVGRLERAQAKAWDEQPEGFSNTIRWNAGHIYSSMEYFISSILPDYTPVHPEWGALFATGTNPGQWEGQPPSNEELLAALKEQPRRVSSVVEGKWDEKLAQAITIGPLTMETVGEVVEFVVWHEGTHAGLIDALVRVTA
ncbi:DinB family protein [Sporosarcina sp. Te-1]|uniref:DinB family protein n=1 Tax=Sporosarcina sp. Te-1 TaxID=2818390 RepID=UPI001A9D0F8D|nr:DinB family protein [Sporosarcina sp. Te-1]QTD40435.1 DinB family protein [Sporosarcina sp. Te-1]